MSNIKYNDNKIHKTWQCDPIDVEILKIELLLIW